MYAADINADLHCHSTASDGVLSPTELAGRAHAHGVALWALTDHDTLAGQQEAAHASAALGLAYVTGVEVSALARGIPIHIVGLHVDLQHPGLAAVLQFNRTVRQRRAHQMASALEARGFKNAFEGAMQIAGSLENLARPHFARYLVASGQAESMQWVFDHLLGNRGSCYVPTIWASAATVIEAINQAGGAAVLAHPLAYRLEGVELTKLVTDFAAQKGRAIEIITGAPATPSQLRRLARLARQAGLAASRGSDFHEPLSGGVELGRIGPLPAGVQPVWTAFPR